MKTSLAFAIPALFLSHLSSASTLDQFHCKLQFQDLSGQAVINRADILVERVPATSPLPAPANLHYTHGQSSLSTQFNSSNHQITLDLDVSYRHAFELDASGVPSRAGMTGCQVLNFSVDGAGLYRACMALQGPVDSLDNYDPVAIVAGIPAIDTREFAPQTVTVTKNTVTPGGGPTSEVFGTATGSCEYLGTVF